MERMRYLNNASPFTAGRGQEFRRQVQHFAQPIHHDHLQVGASRTGDLAHSIYPIIQRKNSFLEKILDATMKSRLDLSTL